MGLWQTVQLVITSLPQHAAGAAGSEAVVWAASLTCLHLLLLVAALAACVASAVSGVKQDYVDYRVGPSATFNRITGTLSAIGRGIMSAAFVLLLVWLIVSEDKN